ncbi:MAG: hypothetical protein WDZ45_01445 [Flavobacteriaceae bacterium]
MFEIPFIKKYHKKKGWNPYDERDKLWNDKITGFNIIAAGGIIGGVIFGILISSFSVISRVFNLYDYVPGFYFVIFGVIAMLIVYLYVLKNNRYLDYFEQFEKWPKSEKRKNVFLSFLLIIATIAYFFMGLMCC